MWRGSQQGLVAASEVPDRLVTGPGKEAPGSKSVVEGRMPVRTLGTQRRKLRQERAGLGLQDGRVEVPAPQTGAEIN